MQRTLIYRVWSVEFCTVVHRHVFNVARRACARKHAYPGWFAVVFLLLYFVPLVWHEL